jgi:phosphate-selective porin OprO and OprP
MAFSRQVSARGARRGFFSTSVALTALLVPALIAGPALAADDQASGDDTEALRRELRLEEQHIRELEKRLSEDEAARAREQAAAAALKPAPDGSNVAATAGAQPPNSSPAPSPGIDLIGRFGADGFTLSSADGQNVIRFRGNVSLDYRYFDDSITPTTADTFLVRKARPTLEGTLGGMFDFRLMPDFAQGKTILQDAWADARFQSWLILQVGKFKAPVGLERLQLEQFARFIEASLTSDLLPYRDLGAQLGGNLGQGLLSYQVGVFDGAPDSSSTDSNSVPDINSTGKFVWDARIFSHPFALTGLRALQGFGIGIAGTYTNVSGTTTATSTTSLLASYKTTGQQSLFSYRSNTATGYNNATIARGIERRWVPQLNYYYGPFGVLGEYVHADQQVFRQVSATGSRAATLDNHAWQVQGYLFLTGEKESYDRLVVPRHGSVGHGGIGAWEIVARYHQLRFDDAAFAGGANSFANPLTSPRAAIAVGAGLNWYLDPNFKIQLDYEVTHFDGGAASGDRPDERVLTSQFALVF